MGGWGKGQIRISVAANEIRWWQTKWPDVKVRQRVFNDLMGHEMGHLILNTTSQDIFFPLNSAMRARGIAHWGKSQYRSRSFAGPRSDELAIVEQVGKNAVDAELMERIAAESAWA